MSPSAARSPLSVADIERLRRALVEKREALLEAQRSTLSVQRGVVAAESEDADAAEQLIEQESALRLASFDAALLVEVERALAKIEAGTFGRSEVSGEAIPLERLEVVPWARRRVEEEER